MNALLQTNEAVRDLIERLGSAPVIARYGQAEAATLSHAFTDLEVSMRRFLHEQLPKLADPSLRGERLDDLLLEVREEFRHMLYHLHDPEFLRVLEPTHEWLTVRADG